VVLCAELLTGTMTCPRIDVVSVGLRPKSMPRISAAGVKAIGAALSGRAVPGKYVGA
jgi:hypothetical protein